MVIWPIAPSSTEYAILWRIQWHSVQASQCCLVFAVLFSAIQCIAVVLQYCSVSLSVTQGTSGSDCRRPQSSIKDGLLSIYWANGERVEIGVSTVAFGIERKSVRVFRMLHGACESKRMFLKTQQDWVLFLNL